MYFSFPCFSCCPSHELSFTQSPCSSDPAANWRQFAKRNSNRVSKYIFEKKYWTNYMMYIVQFVRTAALLNVTKTVAKFRRIPIAINQSQIVTNAASLIVFMSRNNVRNTKTAGSVNKRGNFTFVLMFLS